MGGNLNIINQWGEPQKGGSQILKFQWGEEKGGGEGGHDFWHKFSGGEILEETMVRLDSWGKGRRISSWKDKIIYRKGGG